MEGSNPCDNGIVLAGQLFVGDKDGHWKRRHVAITKSACIVVDIMPLILMLYGWRKNRLDSHTFLPKNAIVHVLEYVDVETRIRLGLVLESMQWEGMFLYPPTSTSESMQQLELLPDHARRSRHSELSPFILRHPRGGDILLAAEDGPTMWEWAFTIRWRGNFPFPLDGKFQKLEGCDTVSRNPNHCWTNGSVLQERLLKLLLLYTPHVDITSKQWNTVEASKKEGWAAYQSGWTPCFSQLPHYSFDGCCLGRCLVGACIHGGEKNVELLLSLGILDLSHLHSGNSPQSMTCEGDYSPQRAYILESLLRAGSEVHGTLRASGSYSYIFMLTKPDRLAASRSILGRPVHPDDKEIVKMLIRKGVDSDRYDEAEEKIKAAAVLKRAEFCFSSPQSYDGLSSLPPQISSLAPTLLKIDLSRNCLTELPDEFFTLKCLKEIVLKQNCLYEVSASFKNFSSLEVLDVSHNLVERLPVSLVRLKNLKTLVCRMNPISQPPQEVWMVRNADPSTVAKRVQAFFQAIVDSGSVENLALKVMVLGRSEVGKTSLISALIEKVSRLTRAGDRTVGIGQRTWTIPLPLDKKTDVEDNGLCGAGRVLLDSSLVSHFASVVHRCLRSSHLQGSRFRDVHPLFSALVATPGATLKNIAGWHAC